MKADITSKTIDGITDLVVWAPIREGFIDAFANITYEARLRLVAEALHNVRRSAREHEELSPFPDTAERILSLLDFRIGIVDKDLHVFEEITTGTSGEHPGGHKNGGVRPRRYMYLVATFDGPWEPYMRLIWDPLGAFLDLLLCNCEGYEPAVDNSFEVYAKWVREHQLDSAIFYSTSGLTVKDKKYLTKLEKYQREMDPNSCDQEIAQMTSDNPETLAESVRTNAKNAREVTRLALEALTVLYKLADYYPADRINHTARVKHPDGSITEYEGTYLLRVARSILKGWESKVIPARHPLRLAYQAPLNWFETDVDPYPSSRENNPDYIQTEVQKGLITSYDKPGKRPMTHGVLLLLKVTDVLKAKKFIRDFPCSWEASEEIVDLGEALKSFTRNVVFTFQGLERLGLCAEDLAMFPKEFREGAEARAPVNGDKFRNHPRRWSLPKRYNDNPESAERPVVELHEVDMALHLRTADIGIGFNPDDFVDFEAGSFEQAVAFMEVLESSSVLKPEAQLMSGSGKSAEGVGGIAGISEIFQHLVDNFDDFNSNKDGEDYSPFAFFIFLLSQLEGYYGIKMLAVESMFRPGALEEKAQDDNLAADDNAPPTRDHFGFRDGLSQPVIVEGGELSQQTDVRRGEILIGYTNGRTDMSSPNTTSTLLRNGSFLAVRKIEQKPQVFEKFLEDTANNTGHSEDEIAAYIVGRDKDGVPLIPSKDNNFDYKGDPKGEVCPFASHIRRTNPRNDVQERKSPLILRRGMSYGSRYSHGSRADDRGIMFMAYCASLAEQYEIVLRWINGGNSTDISSAQVDPLCGPGLRDEREPYVYRIIVDGKVERWKIPEPFTTLKWSNYFFVPSRKALNNVIAAPIADDAAARRARRIKQGMDIILSLERLPDEVQQNEWKRILEDYLTKDPTENNISPYVWNAIAAKVEDGGLGGAYKVDAGIAKDMGRCPHKNYVQQSVTLVAEESEILEVLKDHNVFSVKEQGRRMGDDSQAFGMIYVARDPSDPGYGEEAYPTNTHLYEYSEEVAFEDGYTAGVAVLNQQKALAEQLAGGKPPELKMEIGRQYISQALGHLCRHWFGVPDANGTYFELGAWNWEVDPDRKPRCPGDFMSPSRAGFYPVPTTAIDNYAKRHGTGLRKAVRQMVKENAVSGEIGAKIASAHNGNPDVIERNLIGIMIGALPPMDASLRFTFLEWLKEDTLWRHQGQYHAAKDKYGNNYTAAKRSLEIPIMAAMSKRPAPDLIYRTALSDYTIGKVSGKAGDLIVLTLVAATQKRLQQGDTPNVDLVFGRDRPGKSQPVHGCPAQKMAMGGMMGILAAFIDAGRIQALPSSLIVRLTDWDPVTPPAAD